MRPHDRHRYRAVANALLAFVLLALLTPLVSRTAAGAQRARASPQEITELRTDVLTAGGGSDESLSLDVFAALELRVIAPTDPNWKRDNPQWVALFNVVRQDLNRDLQPAMRAQETENARLQDDVLSSHLSSGEVGELLAFYRSNVGRRYLAFEQRLSSIQAKGLSQLTVGLAAGGVDPASVPHEFPSQEIVDARQRMLANSWSSLLLRGVMPKVEGTASGADPQGKAIMESMLDVVAKTHGPELDDLRRQYGSDLTQFDAFQRSATVKSLLSAFKALGEQTAAGAAGVPDAFKAALDRSIAVHTPSWKAAYEAGRSGASSPQGNSRTPAAQPPSVAVNAAPGKVTCLREPEARAGATTGDAQLVAQKITDLCVGRDVSALAFSPDGQRLAARTPSTPDVYVCELSSRRCTVWTNTAGESMGAAAHLSALRYSPDGRFLALVHEVPMTYEAHPTFSWGSVVHVWGTGSQKLVYEIGDDQGGNGVPALEFSPDSRWLLRLYNRGGQTSGDSFVVWGTSDWRLSWSLRTLPFQPKAMALSADGKTVALAGSVFQNDAVAPAQIWIVNMETRSVIRKFDAFTKEALVTHMCLSPDGEVVAVGANAILDGDNEDTLKLFAVRTGKVVASVRTAKDLMMYGLTYAQNGKYLIEDGISGVVTIWDSSLTRVVQQIDVGPALRIGPGPLAVSRDGRLLAVGVGPAVSVYELK